MKPHSSLLCLRLAEFDIFHQLPTVTIPRVERIANQLTIVVHGVVKETLSKVAVANEEVVSLLTANPIYTFCAMLTV